MRRVIASAVLFGVAITIGFVVLAWWPVVIGAIVVGGAWSLMTCRHPGKLGLLPPVVSETGERLPARWYCDQCGESWPAGITHEAEPIQRFSGYDESKARSAARRASELEAAQRGLAVRRSGAAPAPPAPKKPRPAAVPFGTRRRPGPEPVNVDGRLAG
jgi:hypothetical protein